MIKFLKNIFFKEELKKCEHGWEIEKEDRLPIKRTSIGFSVCPDCALKSSLSQLGSGIVLDEKISKKLKQKLNNLRSLNE